MSVFRKVVLTTIVATFTLSQAVAAYAGQPVKTKTKLSSQEWCLADIIQGENNTSVKGRVAVGIAALNRAYSGKWGKVGNVCAVRVVSQFHYLKKKNRPAPGAAARAVARQLLADVARGKPTLEAKLQLQLVGVESFHDGSYKPSKQWNKSNAYVLATARQTFYKPRNGRVVNLYD